jgi:putative ABC transport system permease protein
VLSMRWRKTLRDLWLQRGRAGLVVLAMTLGVFGVVWITSSSAVLTRQLHAQYLATDPASATVFAQGLTAQALADVRSMPEVAHAETWLNAPITVGATPTASSTPTLYGVPADTPMLALPVLSGRWLQPGDTRAVVISHNLAKAHPDLTAGGTVQLRLNGRLDTWHVVGIVRQVAAPPAAWTTYRTLAGDLQANGTTTGIRILTSNHDADAVKATRKALDNALTTAGITISTNQDTAGAQKALRDHILVISTFLGLLTLLSVLIGGLGLATTMAINVIERIREIGVLRAVGATTSSVLTLVITEAGIIGALSWLAALVLAVPASIVFGQVIGEILLESPLDFAVNPLAPVIWLALVVTLSALASFAPARRAADFTVRDALTHL